MLDFTSFPATSADNSIDSDAGRPIAFSTTEKSDEQKIYQQINSLLGNIEISLEIDEEALSNIREMSNKLHVLTDEKEEVLLRIDWLKRLNETNKEMTSVRTKEEAESLQRKISGVQTCPLKNKLQQQLIDLVNSLPSQAKGPSIEDLFMERAIEELGDEFINLGTAGREAVIATVTSEGDLNLEKVREKTRELENSAMQLHSCQSAEEVAEKLNALPLSSWNEQSKERKQQIATHLMGQQWNGLAMLDRIIQQQVNRMEAEHAKLEMERNMIEVPGGKAVSVIDSKNFGFKND